VLTVSDMIAQIVVARKLEAEFRRRREADLERLSQRSRVAPGRWKAEVDAHSVFTSCRHDLLLRVVEAATEEEWLAGYVSRFLRASERQPDAFSGSRRLGTMPGTPLSTVLADLFLYYALDRWAMDHFPEVKLFRELDSAVVHCQTEQQARSIRAAIWQRLDDVSLKVTKADIQVDRAAQGEQTEVFAMPTAEVRNAARLETEEDSSEDRAAKRAAKARSRAGKGRSWAVLITLMMLFFVLSFTHELSPYILIIQIAVLAGGRLLRPRWLPVAFAAIAFGYLLPRLSYVNSQYGLLSSIGSFFSNVAPPSATTDTLVTIPSSQIFGRAVPADVAAGADRRLAATAVGPDRPGPGRPDLLPRPGPGGPGVRQRGGPAGLPVLAAVGGGPGRRRAGAPQRHAEPDLGPAARAAARSQSRGEPRPGAPPPGRPGLRPPGPRAGPGAGAVLPLVLR
jgi:hypothetical protein